MSNQDLAPRPFSRMDAGRSAISVALMAVVFAAWWFLLPWIQAMILPTAPGGTTGPWVIRPILACRFGACAIAATASMPPFVILLRRRWDAQDAAAGTQFNLLRDRPGRKAGLVIAGGALALIYASALLYYLLSWAVVSPTGIEERLPRGRVHHSFAQVTALQMIPSGMRSDKMAKNGPWYGMAFSDGHSFTFGNDNEGSSEAELLAIARFIAGQSRQPWRVRSDVKQR